MTMTTLWLFAPAAAMKPDVSAADSIGWSRSSIEPN